ncbi:MAG: putative ammonia monooxygenase, partial [uncultured Blastococcus sp.]
GRGGAAAARPGPRRRRRGPRRSGPRRDRRPDARPLRRSARRTGACAGPAGHGRGPRRRRHGWPGRHRGGHGVAGRPGDPAHGRRELAARPPGHRRNAGTEHRRRPPAGAAARDQPGDRRLLDDRGRGRRDHRDGPRPGCRRPDGRGPPVPARPAHRRPRAGRGRTRLRRLVRGRRPAGGRGGGRLAGRRPVHGRLRRGRSARRTAGAAAGRGAPRPDDRGRRRRPGGPGGPGGRPRGARCPAERRVPRHRPAGRGQLHAGEPPDDRPGTAAGPRPHPRARPGVGRARRRALRDDRRRPARRLPGHHTRRALRRPGHRERPGRGRDVRPGGPGTAAVRHAAQRSAGRPLAAPIRGRL